MSVTTRYQSARIVSEKIAIHFSEQLEKARNRGEQELAAAPGPFVIEQMLDVAFWASLQREEGNSPKISLAYLPPEDSGNHLLFEHKIPLTPSILTKLSPGVERPGVHLGVWEEGGKLYIWGTTIVIPNLCFVLDVSEPGLLVVKHRRIKGFGKFANVAVLIGDQIKLVDDSIVQLPDCPDLLKALLGINDLSYNTEHVNILVQLAVSMRAHKHGGTLLVVPQNTYGWKNSIIHPLKYSIQPAYSGIARLIKQDVQEKGYIVWQDALRREIDRIAGFTAVDGATIINNQFELYTFGAKITRPDGNARIEKISYNEPIEGQSTLLINPAHEGGTRHLSAAQFVHDQKNCLAMVASQDGHFTLYSWSAEAQVVQSHRIDTLLL